MNKKQYIGITKQLNIVSGARANIDAKYGTYKSIQEAIQSIVKESRALGLTVGIIENDVVKEYWWKTGTDDKDLILKIDKAAYTKISELDNDANFVNNIDLDYKVGIESERAKIEESKLEENKADKDYIDNKTTKFKGYYPTVAELETSYPVANNEKDFYAFVGDNFPGIVYKVKVDKGAWVNTGVEADTTTVDLSTYTKTGGSKKSTQHIDEIKVNKEDIKYLTDLPIISNQKEIVIGDKFGHEPGNPFATIYMPYIKLDGLIHNINFVCSKSGDARVLLYEEINDKLILKKNILITANIGDNIVTIEEDFVGYCAVKCETAKFYYNASDTKVLTKYLPNVSDIPQFIEYDQVKTFPGAISVIISINQKGKHLQIEDDIDTLKPLSETITYIRHTKYGINTGTVTDDVSKAIYFNDTLFNKHYINHINLYASAAGDIIVFLYKLNGGFLEKYKEYTINAIIGKNTISVGETFSGYVGVMCPVGKFYYNSPYRPSSLFYYNSNGIIENTIPMDMTSPLDGQISIEIVTASSITELTAIKELRELSPLTEMYNGNMLGQNTGNVAGDVSNSIYFYGDLLDNRNIKELKLYVSIAGQMEVYIYKLDVNNTIKLYKKIDVLAKVGVNVIPINETINGYIGVACPVGKFYYNANYIPSKLSAYRKVGDSDIIDLSSLIPMPGQISLEIHFNVDEDKLLILKRMDDVEKKTTDNKSSIETIKSAVDSLTSVINKYKRIGNIVYSNFKNNNIPSGWSNNGYTSTNAGLEVSVSNGATTHIEYDQYSNLDSFITMFRLNMKIASSVIITNYHKKLSTSAGHVVGFDMINKKLTIYQATNRGVLPSIILKQDTIPFNFTPGRTIVKYERNAMIEYYTIINGINSYTMGYNTQLDTRSTGQGYDHFGLMFLSGDIVVENACYSSQLNQEPDILVVGDSICNGDTIRALNGGGENNRWVGLLSQKTSVSLWSLGGNTVDDINRDLDFILSMFKPKKVIYGVGINDSSFSNFTTKCTTFINKVIAIGAEPILQTLFPRDGRVQYCEDVSNWIKNSNYRYIDFRAKMTINGDGVTRRAELFLSDNLHPNVLGHKEMGEEAIDSLEI